MKPAAHPVFRPLASGLWLLPVLLLATGCHSGPYAPQGDAHPGVSEASTTVVLMDEQVQASVTNVGDRAVFLPDGRLLAQANLKNRESRRIQVQAQCVFKDAQGVSTGDESPWQTLILTENATETVEFPSMNSLARTYTIRVRQAR